MTKLTAVFIGKNSLGYEHGKMYDLQLSGNCICRRPFLDGICEYDSLEALLKNWSVLDNEAATVLNRSW